MAKFAVSALAAVAAGANLRALQAAEDSKPAPAPKAKMVSLKSGAYTLPVTAQLSPEQASAAAKASMACGTQDSFNINGVMPQNEKNLACMSMFKCPSGTKMMSLTFSSTKEGQEYKVGSEVQCKGKHGVSGKESVAADAKKATPAARLLSELAAPANAVAQFEVTNMMQDPKSLNGKIGCIKSDGKLDMTSIQKTPANCMNFEMKDGCTYKSLTFQGTSEKPGQAGVGYAIGAPLTGALAKCHTKAAAPAAEAAPAPSK